MHFQQVDDAFDAIELSQQLLGYLFVVEGVDSAFQDNHARGVGPHDIATQSMWTVFEREINARLQFVGSKLGSGHKAPFCSGMLKRREAFSRETHPNKNLTRIGTHPYSTLREFTVATYVQATQ